MTATASRRSGRPLDPGLRKAIEAAAIELLKSVGYDRLRMQDVAGRAGVGLATIYRRWPTKQQLMCDALRAHKDELLPEPSGDPRTDLTALLRALAGDLRGSAGALSPGFLTATRTEPALAEAFHELVAGQIRDATRRFVAEVVGDDDPALDLRADLGPSLLLFRSMFLGDPVDASEVDRIVDLVLAT